MHHIYILCSAGNVNCSNNVTMVIVIILSSLVTYISILYIIHNIVYVIIGYILHDRSTACAVSYNKILFIFLILSDRCPISIDLFCRVMHHATTKGDHHTKYNGYIFIGIMLYLRLHQALAPTTPNSSFRGCKA